MWSGIGIRAKLGLSIFLDSLATLVLITRRRLQRPAESAISRIEMIKSFVSIRLVAPSATLCGRPRRPTM